MPPAPPRVSTLRARCPDCRTLTAVALGPDYQCHSCGREFGAGLVRVPRAWGAGGEAMAEAAALALPFPEAGVVDEQTLQEQTLALASGLPDRPLVLGGCCCAHLGAIEGLASRVGRLAVVWLDAHGDLNTPETSPSGNAWGMPLRMAIESGAVEAPDVALVGARRLDPGEEAFIARSGVRTGGFDAVEAAATEADGVYVALDCDVFEPSEVSVFMPEPGGPTVAEVARLFEGLAARRPIEGAGLTGLRPDPSNVAPLRWLLVALGL
jgi:arginase